MEEDNILIQIIDVSHKLLYGEAKAEQSFLSLINGAVSHELRNPLNSLISQVSNLDEFFYKFKQYISKLKDDA